MSISQSLSSSVCSVIQHRRIVFVGGASRKRRYRDSSHRTDAAGFLFQCCDRVSPAITLLPAPTVSRKNAFSDTPMDAPVDATIGRTGVSSHPPRHFSPGIRLKSEDTFVCACPGATGRGKTTWRPSFLRAAVLVLVALEQQDVSLFPVEGIASRYRNSRRTVQVHDPVLLMGSTLTGIPSTTYAAPSSLVQPVRATTAFRWSSPIPAVFLGRNVLFEPHRNTTRLQSSTTAATAPPLVQQSTENVAPLPDDSFMQRSHIETAAPVPFEQPARALLDVTTKQQPQTLRMFPPPYTGHELDSAAAATQIASSTLIQANIPEPAQVVKPDQSDRHRHYLEMGLPSAQGTAVSFASGVTTRVDGPEFEKEQMAALVPYEQRVYNGEYAPNSKATRLPASTAWEGTEVTFTEQKQRRRSPTMNWRNNPQMVGVVHLGPQERLTRTREHESIVDPSNCAREAEETGDKEEICDPSGNPSPLPYPVGEDSAAKIVGTLLHFPLSGCPEGTMASQDPKREQGAYFRVTRRLRQQHQRQKHQLDWQEQEYRALPGIEIGASSFLGGTTKNNDEDDEDEGEEEEKNKRKGGREKEEEKKATPTSSAPVQPPTVAPPALTIPPLPLPTPVGIAAGIVGGVAKTAFKLFGL